MKSFKNFLPIAVLGIIAFLLQSCCGHATCDCFDEFEATIQFGFNVDSTKSNSFKKSELLGTLFLEIDTINNKIDTMGQITVYDLEMDYMKRFSIHNFEASKNMNYSNPNIYKIINDSLNLTITNIKAKGHTSGKCNCYCYTNESITFMVNQSGYDKSNSYFVINK